MIVDQNLTFSGVDVLGTSIIEELVKSEKPYQGVICVRSANSVVNVRFTNTRLGLGPALGTATGETGSLN